MDDDAGPTVVPPAPPPTLLLGLTIEASAEVIKAPTGDARAAYGAYVAALGGDMLSWDDLGDTTRGAWVAAALAVRLRDDTEGSQR